MKKFSRIVLYILLSIFIILIVIYIFFSVKWNRTSESNMKLLGEEAPVITANEFTFRDLNKNGLCDPYEDKRVPLEVRIDDLLGQMTLEEKAGLLFITMIGISEDGELSERPSFSDPMSFFFESNSTLVAQKLMNHFNIFQAKSPDVMLNWHNALQKLAERTRLGIPVTIASDPRHGVPENIGASIPTPFFSSWCSPLGLAATGDSALVLEFADIARQEYLSIGIRVALHPMADLATEPRWGRINGTFGEDAELSARLTEAYVRGFQGDSLSRRSVACMTKHFPGGGPQKDGEDAHFPYGAEQAYPGRNFDYHLIPFERGAFVANTAQIMPYYGLPEGLEYEEVAFGYNRDVITGLLREKYGFDGVVCTDWGIITGSAFKPAAAWGVEELSEVDRVAKILDAGCDMFGGESRPELVIELVNNGTVSEERLDLSVRRVLRDKFRLGLFDNPYLDPERLDVLGQEDFVKKGREAQQKSLVLLKNDDNILPLAQDVKIYIEGMDDALKDSYDQVVNDRKDADVVVMKLPTPHEPRSKYLLERFFKQGSLEFDEKTKSRILKKIDAKPTIAVITLDRPAVIPQINAASKAVIADFSCQDDVILDLVLGKYKPTGKLPVEMPSSMNAVNNQMEDLPYDSSEPLYPFGHGLTYE